VVTPASFPDSVVAQPVETDCSVVVPSVSVKYSIWRRNLSEEASGFQSAMCLEPSARVGSFGPEYGLAVGVTVVPEEWASLQSPGS
jgi:hypothetical protein